MNACSKVAVWLALVATLMGTSVAQQSSSDTNAPAQTRPADAAADKQTAQTPEKDKPSSIQETGQGKVAGTSNDRLFYAMPNFLTLQSGQKVAPLTSKQKFKVVALGTFDYFEYPWWGGLAAISQAEDNERGYGQGWVGYAKRYGATAGDSMIENFLVGAVFPSVFHQDPRFFQSSRGGFWRRSFYAATRIVVTRGDSGNSQFNFSEVLGSASAATIATSSYHPRSTFLSTPTNPHLFVPSERTLSGIASTWGTQLTLDSITLMLKEFWPDIHGKLSHKPKKADKSSDQP